MKRGSTGSTSPAPSGHVRVIGGRWRGSKLPVADRPGLRPTSDRVRETLFNWLAPVVRGARCIDLFAGSGALGIEAASRGAADVLLIERDAQLASGLQALAGRLQGGGLQVRHADALVLLDVLAQQPASRFDIAFVDPPFEAGLWTAVFARLPAVLADDAWIHVEAPLQSPPAVPADWQLHREGRTREVRHALYRRRPADQAAAG